MEQRPHVGEASNGLRFLVVDDVATGRTVLGAMLSRYGQVDEAAGGVPALQSYRDAAASGEMYNLLLLDIMMPDMDGITLLKEVRAFEREKGLPATAAVMTTATDAREHVHRAMQAGAVGYLIKPLSFPMVVAELERLGLIEA